MVTNYVVLIAPNRKIEQNNNEKNEKKKGQHQGKTKKRQERKKNLHIQYDNYIEREGFNSFISRAEGDDK